MHMWNTICHFSSFFTQVVFPNIRVADDMYNIYMFVRKVADVTLGHLITIDLD